MDFSLNATLIRISDISAYGDYPFTLFFLLTGQAVIGGLRDILCILIETVHVKDYRLR